MNGKNGSYVMDFVFDFLQIQQIVNIINRLYAMIFQLLPQL